MYEYDLSHDLVLLLMPSIFDDTGNQVNTPQFHLKQKQTTKSNPFVAQLHCIEPLPETYLSLSRSAHNLQYFHNGFMLSMLQYQTEMVLWPFRMLNLVLRIRVLQAATAGKASRVV